MNTALRGSVISVLTYSIERAARGAVRIPMIMRKIEKGEGKGTAKVWS